jgi:branched-chain amino acid transport system substrate-binding protein
VGLLSPTSGELSTFGRQLNNGISLAFDRWNDSGGVNGRRITWQVYNTDCTYQAGQQATQQAIAEGIKFLIGPLCSEAALGAAEVAEAQQVVLIAPTATHPLVTVAGSGQTRQTVFRVSYAFPQQGLVAARFARETLALNQAALLTHPGDDYATLTHELFAQTFAMTGGQIVYKEAYPSNEAELSLKVTAMVEAGAALIYSAGPAENVNQLAAQIERLGLSQQIILLGSDRWSEKNPDLPLTTYATRQVFLAEDNPIAQEWAKTYRATYALAPSTLAVLGYDAADLLGQALQQAGDFEPLHVAAALEQNQFDVLTGPLRFDARHNPLKPMPVVKQQANNLELMTTFLATNP